MMKIRKVVLSKIRECWICFSPSRSEYFLFKIYIQRPCFDCVFSFQVITNACATQAILSLLMNVEDEEVKLGQTLSQFKEFSADFDPTMKGLALSNSDEIRAVHNSFARQSVFEFDAKFAKEDDDVFHFVGNI